MGLLLRMITEGIGPPKGAPESGWASSSPHLTIPESVIEEVLLLGGVAVLFKPRQPVSKPCTEHFRCTHGQASKQQ
jgi:hypothetical protein